MPEPLDTERLWTYRELRRYSRLSQSTLAKRAQAYDRGDPDGLPSILIGAEDGRHPRRLFDPDTVKAYFARLNGARKVS